MARFLYSQDGKVAESLEWPQRSDYLWVDLGPEDRGRIKEVLSHLYQAHPQVIQNLMERDAHRPNLLIEEDAISFTLATIPLEPDLPIHHLSFVLGKHFLVTAHLAESSEVADVAFEKILQSQLLAQGVDFALYQLLQGHVVALRQLANRLDDQFESLHRMLLRHPYGDLSREILWLRKRAMGVKHLLDPEGGVFELLKGSDFPYVQKENRPYFQDVEFLMKEVVQEVGAVREGLAEMVEAYTSLQSNEINKVMWFLTIVSTMSLPATTIASVYGMNFKNMHELYWRYGYFYSLCLMFLVSILLLWWMRIKRHQG